MNTRPLPSTDNFTLKEPSVAISTSVKRYDGTFTFVQGCRSIAKEDGPGLWLFTSVSLVELTSVARSTVRSGKQFWTGAFDLESVCRPRENWPQR
jgi:hypothetical protein